MKKLKEKKYGHGAIPSHPIVRKVHKAMRRKIAKATLPFNWDIGFDVRDLIGPISIKNQGYSSSCGGQAAAYFLEIQRRLKKIKEGAVSAKSLYAPIAYPGGGTTVRALIQQIGTEGANLEAEVPSYFISGEPLTEMMFTEKSWMTPKTAKDAFTRAGYIPYDIKENIDDIAITVRNYGAAIWMIAGQDNDTWRSARPMPPIKGNGEIWHHFMCIIGAKIINGKKTLIVLQSWGEGTGDKGIQYFTEDYFRAKGIVDAFTLIHNSNITPEENNKSIWAEILRFFKRNMKL